MSENDLVLRAEVDVVGVGIGGVGVAVPAARVDVHQPVRPGHGQRPQQQRVDDGEKRGIEPDADASERIATAAKPGLRSSHFSA